MFSLEDPRTSLMPEIPLCTFFFFFKNSSIYQSGGKRVMNPWVPITDFIYTCLHSPLLISGGRSKTPHHFLCKS